MAGRPKIGMTARKRRAAEMLGAGEPDNAVLAELAIPYSTLWRWRRDDVFCDAVRMERNRFLSQVVPRALRKLSDQMQDGNPWLEQNAANSILRERSAVEGTAQQQIVITFAADDTDPGMPVPDEVPLDDGDA